MFIFYFIFPFFSPGRVSVEVERDEGGFLGTDRQSLQSELGISTGGLVIIRLQLTDSHYLAGELGVFVQQYGNYFDQKCGRRKNKKKIYNK